MKKIIHQIYGLFDDGKDISEVPSPENPIFLINTQFTEIICKDQKIEYKLWNKEDCDNLIKSDFYLFQELWDDFFYPIQKADFIRYCILYKYGGIYLDCDIKPYQPFSELFEKEFFFCHWHDDKKKLHYNAVMGSKPKNELFKVIMCECEKSFYEKRNIGIYGEWKGRFIYQTTGHHMLERVMKQEKIDKDKYFLDILKINTKDRVVKGENIFFEDDNISSWY